MTQTTLADLRAGLSAALESVEALETHETFGPPYNLPCAVIEVREIPSYRESMGRGGTIAVPFHVVVLVARTLDDVASSQLDEFTDWVGDNSVPAALEGTPENPQRLGVGANVYVESFELAARTDIDGTPVYGGDFTVTVRAARERD